MTDEDGRGDADGGAHAQARVYPLVGDDANRELLTDWLRSHDEFVPVTDQDIGTAAADICLVDRAGIEAHHEQLQARKERERPALLPVLYLLPDSSAAFLESEYAHLGETFVEATIDEVLSLPVRQAELEWRMNSLLEMRAQTERLAQRDRTLRRLRRAVEAAGEAVFMTDTEGTITYVNPAFEEVTGYGPDEAIGETPHLFYSGEMSDSYYDSLWETILDGQTWKAEIRNERKDGTQYHALQTITPVPDENGEVERFVAIQTDITEQKALEKRQRQYRQAIESSIELLAAIDDDGEFLFANDTYRAYHGLDGETVRGRTLDSILPDEEYAAADARLEAVRNGETVQFETTRTHPELGDRRLDVLYYPLRDDDGAIRGAIASMRDITDQREHSRQLETLIGNLPGIAYRCENTQGWPMDFVGGQCEAITGYGITELEADDVNWDRDIIHPEDRETVREEIRQAVDADESFEVTYRIKTASGETRWVHEQGQEVTPLTATVPMLEGFIMDVTERKEREAELRRQGRAMDEAPIGITISDPSLEDNPLVYVNDGFSEMTGYEREDAVGRNCRFLQGEQTDPEKVATLRDHIDREEPVSVVLRNYRADGSEFWNSLEVAPVRDGDGEVVNYIGFQQDVTERVERQRQLQKIDQILRHNLHNDLNVVQLHAERIRRDSEPPIAESATKIIEKTDSLIETVDKERDIVQLLEGKPTVEPMELMSALQSTVERLRAEYPAATLSLTGPDSVRADGTDMLPVAFTELITNALKHNDSATPRVEVTVRVRDETVTVEIADNGPGIPEMEAETVTGETEETPLYHGGGLGLWFVHLVVRRCGGHIDFVDTASAGSTVAVVLNS